MAGSRKQNADSLQISLQKLATQSVKIHASRDPNWIAAGGDGRGARVFWELESQINATLDTQ